MAKDTPSIGIGQPVYDESGDKVGTVRGFTEDGIVVTSRTGMAGLSIEHERAPPNVGEAELLWRCSECGELGDIEEMPETCPNCGADKEQLYYWTED